MLKSKKGLSGIVISIIMITLVLVAIGIFWTFFGKMIEGQSESAATSAECTGLVIEPSSLTCVADEEDSSLYNCDVKVERKKISTSGAIKGIALTLSSDDGNSSDEIEFPGNVGITKNVEVSGLEFNPDTVYLRFYVGSEDNKNFCSGISQYPEE
jgi:hypothetical protein